MLRRRIGWIGSGSQRVARERLCNRDLLVSLWTRGTGGNFSNRWRWKSCVKNAWEHWCALPIETWFPQVSWHTTLQVLITLFFFSWHMWNKIDLSPWNGKNEKTWVFGTQVRKLQWMFYLRFLCHHVWGVDFQVLWSACWFPRTTFFLVSINWKDLFFGEGQ